MRKAVVLVLAAVLAVAAGTLLLPVQQEASAAGGFVWEKKPEDYRGVFALDSSHVWEVGLFGTINFYDGGRWVSQVSGTTSHLLGVSGLNTTHVWAVGS